MLPVGFSSATLAPAPSPQPQPQMYLFGFQRAYALGRGEVVCTFGGFLGRGENQERTKDCLRLRVEREGRNWGLELVKVELGTGNLEVDIKVWDGM